MDSEGSSSRARETEQTADLDNRGLLQMQNRVMQSQDNELEELERTVASTRVRCSTAHALLHIVIAAQAILQLIHEPGSAVGCSIACCRAG